MEQMETKTLESKLSTDSSDVNLLLLVISFPTLRATLITLPYLSVLTCNTFRYFYFQIYNIETIELKSFKLSSSNLLCLLTSMSHVLFNIRTNWKLKSSVTAWPWQWQSLLLLLDSLTPLHLHNHHHQ